MNDIAFSVIIKNDGISDIIFKTIMLKGQDGNSIASIEKTSTSGLVDTYSIYLTDGTIGGTFEVKNGTLSTFDDELDATSTNAVQNKVVKSAIDDLDDRVSDLENVTIDTELSTTSTKAVENRAIKNAIDNLTAEDISFDNADTELASTDVQNAIVDILELIPAVDSTLDDSSDNAIANSAVKNALDDLGDDLVDLGHDIDNLQSEIDDIDEIIDNNFTEQWVTATGNKENGYYINSNGVKTAFSNLAYCVFTISVNAGEKYKLTAWAGYSGYYYAYYDNQNNFISGKQSGSGASTILADEETTAPDGASILIIAGNTTVSGTASSLVSNGLLDNAIFKWSGKKWVVIGDSLTEHNGRTTKNYHDYIAENTGITVVNMGVSGTGYRNGGQSSNPFYSRVLNIPTDADVVTIFGSFNDGLTDLGTADDTGTTTIGGCINTTIDNIYNIMPTVQLGIVSPTPWVASNPYNHPEANAYADLLEAICKKRSIPFLNLYYESNLRPWDSIFRTLAYSKDDGNGVHPDETGHKLIASRFKQFIESLLI